MMPSPKYDSSESLRTYTNNATISDGDNINEADVNTRNKGPIKKIWGTVTALFRMVKDPNAAKASKLIAIGALLYLICPIDAVPDFIPLLGLTDDAGVIAAAVAALGIALNKYRDNK